MFTGIISDIGEIRSFEQRGDVRAVIACHYDMPDVDIGASIACSGACLTVTEKGNDWFAVDMSAETLSKTAKGLWVEGAKLNLERALKVGDELGGHIVTGHVDGVGEVIAREAEGDSTRLTICAPGTLSAHIAEKGSITVNGVSLTVNAVHDRPDGRTDFGLNVIPHTAQMTTLGDLQIGGQVNLEIDILTRYLSRMHQVQAQRR